MACIKDGMISFNEWLKMRESTARKRWMRNPGTPAQADLFHVRSPESEIRQCKKLKLPGTKTVNIDVKSVCPAQKKK